MTITQLEHNHWTNIYRFIQTHQTIVALTTVIVIIATLFIIELFASKPILSTIFIMFWAVVLSFILYSVCGPDKYKGPFNKIEKNYITQTVYPKESKTFFVQSVDQTKNTITLASHDNNKVEPMDDDKFNNTMQNTFVDETATFNIKDIKIYSTNDENLSGTLVVAVQKVDDKHIDVAEAACISEKPSITMTLFIK